MRYAKKGSIIERKSNRLEVRTFLTFGAVEAVDVQLKYPVRMPVSGMQKVEDLTVCIIGQALDKPRGWRGGDELDFISRGYEKVIRPLVGEVERHTVLVQTLDNPVDGGDQVARQLITVRFDLKYPRFIHVRRIARRIRGRYLRRKYRLPARVGTPSSQMMREGRQS